MAELNYPSDFTTPQEFEGFIAEIQQVQQDNPSLVDDVLLHFPRDALKSILPRIKVTGSLLNRIEQRDGQALVPYSPSAKKILSPAEVESGAVSDVEYRDVFTPEVMHMMGMIIGRPSNWIPDNDFARMRELKRINMLYDATKWEEMPRFEQIMYKALRFEELNTEGQMYEDNIFKDFIWAYNNFIRTELKEPSDRNYEEIERLKNLYPELTLYGEWQTDILTWITELRAKLGHTGETEQEKRRREEARAAARNDLYPIDFTWMMKIPGFKWWMKKRGMTSYDLKVQLPLPWERYIPFFGTIPAAKEETDRRLREARERRQGKKIRKQQTVVTHRFDVGIPPVVIVPPKEEQEQQKGFYRNAGYFPLNALMQPFKVYGTPAWQTKAWSERSMRDERDVPKSEMWRRIMNPDARLDELEPQLKSDRNAKWLQPGKGKTPEKIIQYNVYDGDTIYLTTKSQYWGSKNYGIRLAGINTPEIRGASPEEMREGRVSRDYLRSRVDAARVLQLRDISTDKYKRSVAILFLDGKDVISDLIRLGFGERRNYGGRSHFSGKWKDVLTYAQIKRALYGIKPNWGKAAWKLVKGYQIPGDPEPQWQTRAITTDGGDPKKYGIVSEITKTTPQHQFIQITNETDEVIHVVRKPSNVHIQIK